MLKKLSEKGLINYKPYQGAALTEAGCAIAAKVKRKHRLPERFLADICGIDTRESHKQACEIEHLISDKAVDNLSAQSGLPSTCPGGSAVPESSSEDETPVSKLSDVGKGAYTIRFLSWEEPETISRLCSLGLILGLTVRVLRSIAKGPLSHRDEGYANRARQGRRRVPYRESGRAGSRGAKNSKTERRTLYGDRRLARIKHRSRQTKCERFIESGVCGRGYE